MSGEICKDGVYPRRTVEDFYGRASGERPISITLNISLSSLTNMTDHRNSAQRILTLIRKALQQSDQMGTAQVWAETLGLDSKIAAADPHEVQKKLGLIRVEIDLTKALMEGTQFSKHLYEPYLDRVKNVVSVHNLSVPWASYKGSLQADALLALDYCAEILPSEPPISMEELQDVLNTVVKLRNEIEALSLSPGIREFLLRQLEIMETGILDYPISGSGAIGKAFREGYVDIVSTNSTVETSNDEEGYSKVLSGWRKFSKSAGEVVTLDRFAIAFTTRLEQIKVGTVELLDKLTG